MWQAVTKEEKVFSPWDLDEIREINNGLIIVMRKEEGVGAKTALSTISRIVNANEWEGHCSR